MYIPAIDAEVGRLCQPNNNIIINIHITLKGKQEGNCVNVYNLRPSIGDLQSHMNFKQRSILVIINCTAGVGALSMSRQLSVRAKEGQ